MKALAGMVVVVVLLGACGGGSKSTAAPTTTSTLATTVPVTAAPVTTDPNVGMLCANAVNSFLDYVMNTLGGNVTNDLYGDTPFSRQLLVTLNDC